MVLIKYRVEIPEVHYAVLTVDAISILDAIRKGVVALENGEEETIEFSHRPPHENIKVYNAKGELVY